LSARGGRFGLSLASHLEAFLTAFTSSLTPGAQLFWDQSQRCEATGDCQGQILVKSRE